MSIKPNKTMPVEKKLIIILIISFALTITAFFISEDPRNPNAFRSIMEILMMTFLLAGFIAINYFALAFLIKGIRNWRNR